MVFAAELALRSGHLSRGRRRAAPVGAGVGGAADLVRRGGVGDLLTAMRRDKKARGAMLRFVVLEDVGRPVRLEAPDDAWLVAAFAAVAHPLAPGAQGGHSGLTGAHPGAARVLA